MKHLLQLAALLLIQAFAAPAVHASTAEQLVTQLKGAGLNASASGSTVTVTGTVTNARKVLELTIDAGVTIRWQATYSGSAKPLITLWGTGAVGLGKPAFEVTDGGNIRNIESGAAISGNNDVQITVTGSSPNSYGSVIAGSGSAITCGGEGNTVYVTGYGYVASSVVSTMSGVINMDCTAMQDDSPSITNVYVSGYATVAALADKPDNAGYGIRTYGSVEVSGGNVYSVSDRGRGINILGINSGATVSGGQVWASGGNSSVAVSTANTKVGETDAPVAVANTKILIDGGVVRNLGTGMAIRTRGSNSQVSVICGLVAATTGYAISNEASGDNIISVTGGLVFGYGQAPKGATGNENNIFYTNGSDRTTITTPALAVAWNNRTGIYAQGTATDLLFEPASPDPGLSWQNFGNGMSGFDYTINNDCNDMLDGHFPLPVRVTSDYGLIFNASTGIMYRNVDGDVDDLAAQMIPANIYEDGKDITWHVEPSTPGILYLNGFQWATTTQAALIITGADATIQLAGANNLYAYSTGNEPNFDSYSGLLADNYADITVQGNGQLNAFAGTEQMEGTFTDGVDRFYSGISGDNATITLNSGILAGWGLSNYTNAHGEGIFLEDGVTFNGGLLAAGGSETACANGIDGLPGVYTYYQSTESPESLLAAGYDIDTPYTGVAPYNEPYTYSSDQKVIMISLYPFGMIESKTVEGAAGLLMTPQTATVTLYGDVVNAAGFTDVDATGWFASLPYGVTVTATAAAGSDKIEFTFAGTPHEAGSTVMSIVIPTDVLAGVLPIAVQPNEEAKIDIKPRVSLSLSLAAETQTYTGLPLYISPATMRGAVAGIATEPIVYSYLKEGETTPATSVLGAGTYTVTASVADNDYYFGAEATATLTVNKAKPQISANSVVTPYTGSAVNVNVASITGSTTADADLRGTLKYLYSGTDSEGNPFTSDTPTGPVNSGVYTVKVWTVGDDNHLPAEETVDIIIKETVPVMYIRNVEKDYDGTPLARPNAIISVAALQAGITYTFMYTHDGYGVPLSAPTEFEDNNDVVEAGIYTVTAHTAGDANYTEASITGKLTIHRKATLVEMHSKSVHYGTTFSMAPKLYTAPEHTEITADPGIVITKYRGIHGTSYESAIVPSAVGEYEVTAEYAGNNNYLPSAITATLAITQASAPRIDMEDLTVTYDALPHLIDVTTVKVWSAIEEDENGNPTGVSEDITDELEGKIHYTYQNSEYGSVTNPVFDAVNLDLNEAPTEAGVYTVTAITEATDEYAAATATATLTIQQATQSITFSLPASVVYGSKPFIIEDAILHRPLGSNDRPLSFTSDNIGIATIEDLDDEPGTELGDPDIALVTIKGIGTVNITVSETSNNNFKPVSVTKTMVVTKAPLTVTLNDDEATYTGQPIHIDPARVAGEIQGAPREEVVYAYYDADDNLLDGPPTNAGTYRVTATVAGNTYYDQATDDAVFTIHKRTPVIDATGGSREYTGEEQPIDNPVVTGSDSDPEITYFDNEGNELPGAPTDAGDYTVTVTVPGDENHEEVTVTVTLTIDPANPNLNLDGVDDKVYDGVPANEATVPGASDLGMEVDITYTGTDGTVYGPLTTPPTDAGHYTVTATVTDPEGNYNTVTLTEDFDITKATPVVIITNKTEVYSGDPIGIVTPVVVKGDAGTEVTVTYTGAGGTEYGPTTTPPTVTGHYTVTAVYEESDNYNKGTFYGSLVITAASPHITMPDSIVTYNGLPRSLIATVTEDEAKPELEVTYHNANYPLSTTPPTNAGVYSVTASTAATANYAEGSVTATLTILKAQPVIDFDLPESVPYGSAAFNVEASISSDELDASSMEYQSGNTGTANITIAGDVTPLNAGVATITVSHPGNENWLPASLTKSITVTKAKLQLFFSGNETVTYTGAPLYISPATLTGAGGSTEFPVTYSYKLGDVTTDHALNVAVYEVTASVADNSNYESTTATATFTVVKATPVITLVAVSTFYTGNPVPVNTPVVTGSLTAGDLPLTILYKGANGTDYAESEIPPTAAGNYTVTVSTVGDANHNPATATTTVLIGSETDMLMPNIGMSDASKIYDGTALEAYATVVPNTLTVTYSYAGTLKDGTDYPAIAQAPTEAGSYTVTASTTGNADYAAASVTAHLEIMQKDAEIAITNKTAIYTGSPVAVMATLIEPAAGTLAYIYKGINDTDYESSDAPTAVGEYEVTAAYAGSNNYRQAIAVAHLVITDAADDLPELSLSNLTVVYDGQPHAIGTATCPTGLTVTYFYRGAGYNSTTPPTNAGIYRVTATTAATDEYSAGEVTAKLTILKAQQVIDFILPESVPYGSPVLNINATVNGAAADGATVYKSGNTNSATINTGNVEYVNAGVAAITVSHPGDNNYLPASLTKTVTVTRAQLLLTLDSETVPYTGSPVYITPATLAGAVGDAVFTITYSYKLGDVTDDHAQETGLYTVTATVAGDANHIGNVATATLEVTKAQLELHFSGNETVTYTGAPLYISPATLTGAGGSTEFPVTYSYKLGDVTTDHALNVAVYEVTATVTGNSYYEGTTATATFTVVKATPVITLVSVSTLYTGKQVTVNTPVVTGSLTANQLAVTLIYEGINGTDYPLNISAPTEAGHYRVTAHTDGDSNHNPATTTTTILIGPATPTMSIADASKVYDGAPLVAVAQILQSTLTITYSYAGTLKDGTNYPATATPPTEAGDYTVTASTAGNADYTAAQVMANLEIIPAQAVIEIHGKTAKYTGSPIGINAPVVITPAGGTMGQVIYKGILGTVYAESSTAPVEVGTYQASASYGGSNNYLATVVTARLTITQRDPGLSLANKTVVYNTQPQGYAAGDAVITPPEAVGELAVTYTYHSANYPASTTPPTNAGTYSVSATTLANEHYAAGEVTARLIIKRAPQTITFTLPASMATGAAQVNIDANASSGLTPLVYASGNEGIATIVNGVLTPLATGVAAITVSQAGDHNWLPASVTKTVTVTAGGGNEIITIEVDGNDIPVADNMTYVAPCGGNNAKAVIGMTVSEGATVSYRINGVTTENVGTNFEITLGEPQIKKVYIIVKSQDGSATKEYLLNIEVRFPFFQIVVMRWNNTLTVINNPENNKGYAFNTFKWYRSTDGGATFETFSNEQSWSAGANGELLSETVLYYVEVTSDLFEGTLRTCVDHVTLKENMKVTAYPNPVTKGQTVYIDVDIDDTSLLEGAFIEVYDVAGRRLNHFEAQGSHTEVTVDYPMGVYLFVFKGINGFHHELKIAITK